MLGIEETSTTAMYLEVGDHLSAAETGEGWKFPGAEIVEIAPTSDPWLDPSNLDVRLSNGETLTLAPHSWVRIICDPRELSRRVIRINKAREAAEAAKEVGVDLPLDEEQPPARRRCYPMKSQHTPEQRANAAALWEEHRARKSAWNATAFVEGRRLAELAASYAE